MLLRGLDRDVRLLQGQDQGVEVKWLQAEEFDDRFCPNSTRFKKGSLQSGYNLMSALLLVRYWFGNATHVMQMPTGHDAGKDCAGFPRDTFEG